MGNNEFEQQDVIALRREDLLLVMQGARQRRLKVGAIIDYIAGQAQQQNWAGQADWDEGGTTATAFIRNKPANVSDFTNDAGFITSSSLPVIPTNVSAFTNDAGYIDSSALSGLVTSTALSSTLANYTTLAVLSATLAASYSTTTQMNTAIAAAVANVPKLYNNSALVAAPIEYVNTKTLTVAGTVTFPTVDGSGNPLFANFLYMKAEVSDAANSYNYAYTVAGDKKSVTVTVMRSSATVIALLGLSLLSAPANAPVGTVVSLLIKGN